MTEEQLVQKIEQWRRQLDDIDCKCHSEEMQRAVVADMEAVLWATYTAKNNTLRKG